MSVKQFFILLAIAAIWSASSDAFARKWKPSPTESAQYYLTIEHRIFERESVILIWFAPEYFENKNETGFLRNMAQEYMMVGMIHFTISELGEFETKKPEKVTIDLSNSVTLNVLPENTLPPVVVSQLGLIRNIASRGMGKLGAGLTMFVFDGKQFDRCADGMVWVRYLAERYEFQTPLPGCN